MILFKGLWTILCNPTEISLAKTSKEHRRTLVLQVSGELKGPNFKPRCFEWIAGNKLLNDRSFSWVPNLYIFT